MRQRQTTVGGEAPSSGEWLPYLYSSLINPLRDQIREPSTSRLSGITPSLPLWAPHPSAKHSWPPAEKKVNCFPKPLGSLLLDWVWQLPRCIRGSYLDTCACICVHMCIYACIPTHEHIPRHSSFAVLWFVLQYWVCSF